MRWTGPAHTDQLTLFAPSAYIKDADQLTLFWDPADIVARIEAGEWHSVDYVSKRNGGWDRKLTEATYNGDLQSIRSEGIRHPVVLIPGRPGFRGVSLGNGHHRTAVAWQLGQRLIPVVWSRFIHAGLETEG